VPHCRSGPQPSERENERTSGQHATEATFRVQAPGLRVAMALMISSARRGTMQRLELVFARFEQSASHSKESKT
jgi:hypothetical protein